MPDPSDLEHRDVDAVPTELERRRQPTVAGTDEGDVDTIGQDGQRPVGGRGGLPPVRRGREAGSEDVAQVSLRDACP